MEMLNKYPWSSKNIKCVMLKDSVKNMTSTTTTYTDAATTTTQWKKS